MKKLSISIDMGAKNNGIFIVKTKDDKIIDKKASCIIIDKGAINFSKKSRRENRHKDRNYKRRKLVKRLLKELIDFSKYDEKQTELIFGLLNNRGYTFISTSTEFEKLNDVTIEFINKYLIELKDLKVKEDFENKISSFDDLEELKEFIKNINDKIDIEIKKKKAEFYKEFQQSFSGFIKKDLQDIKKLFISILNEIETGSKPRSKYFDDIKIEIEKDFDFIEDFTKNDFFNLIGNISNLQLRVLRKYFNNKYDNKLDLEKLDIKIRGYFKALHYKSDKEKIQRKELAVKFDDKSNILDFLKNTNPTLTIPPYEDMNNRDTYKCNSMLIKPELINDDLKYAVDTILKNDNFSNLIISNNGEFKIEEDFRVKPSSDDKYNKTDFTYSKYLQRILDATQDITTKELNPRNVFKYMKTFNKGTILSVKEFKKTFGDNIYFDLEKIANLYYEEENKIYSGIYEESTSIFIKCNTNTSYKNNVKHTLLKPIYSYNFTPIEADEFLNNIKNTYGLKAQFELISSEAKKYQNSFYNVIISCFENQQCVDDKDIKKIIKNLSIMLKSITEILKSQDISTSCLNDFEDITPQNISRVLNIFKQTYEVLFKELSGFSKTCKHCTKENALRSDEKLTIGKRLLSDVAKPIDGMLDMMLDRLAFEIIKDINEDDIKDVKELDILLEQNKFEFEENLNDIKRANNPSIKKYKREDKNRLNSLFCPYTGEKFDKGEYDHILPQSKEVYNSKANMIYASSKGNRDKGAKDYTFENLSDKHLNDIFKTIDKNEIKLKIKEGMATIKKEEFKNFEALKLTQQIALRYALFLKQTDEFKKAFELVKMDKIKTITNGTQKRLARIIYEKLVQKYPIKFKEIKVSSKTIDNMLVSTTRKSLSSLNEELEKEQYQQSHSHCIDAMVVYYLANAKVKNQNSFKDTILEPKYDFDDIYLKESGINNISKNVTFINSPKKEMGSYKLFDDTVYSEQYRHITIQTINKKDFETLIKYSLLFINKKGKKDFLKNINDLEDETIYKLDVQKVSNTVYKLFNDNNKTELSRLKFLDKLQYFTSRKEIQNIFFDEKQIKLLEFDKIKNIPYFSKNLYKAVYKKLQNESNLFNKSEDKKTTLNYDILNELLKDMFSSKQKIENKEERKRDKKRHKYTLPMLGSPKFRINRNKTWQILGNKDIATKNYIVDGAIKPIAFFSQNTIPVKVTDLLDCLLIDKDTKSVYDIGIDISEITRYISKLKYLVTEAKRCTLIVSFKKNDFIDIDFNNIKLFDGAKDEIFKQLIDNYIDNKELEISKYIGSIRDGSKAKAMVVNNNSEIITLQYKAGITSIKKQIILDNLKENTNDN